MYNNGIFGMVCLLKFSTTGNDLVKGDYYMESTEKIGKVKLQLELYSGNDMYSDGESEDRLLEIVKTHSSDDFDSIILDSRSWELMYHLSDLRQNILDWYEFDPGSEVLEIGAGCGAITGVLAKKCKSVDCIELSKKRSLINAYRNKNYDNICIHVGNFQDIEKTIVKKYDVITLIGVLEYAESYIDAKDPYREFLKISKQHLKDGGKLIIAIENKLGMKYWAGCKEDHVGMYYESLEGYTKSSGVKTFGKTELSEMFEAVGFSSCEFYYPYPDYKFADTIYSDNYLPKPGDLGNNMRNFDRSRIISFDEGKVFDSVIKNGLFPFYSNSFLVILEK